MRRLFHLFLFVTATVRTQSCTAEEIPSCSKVMDYAQNHLPHEGILKSSGGFVYVDIDDDYIHKLVPMIQEYGFKEPPYFGSEGLVGAHITVIYPDELKNHKISEITECGEPISFSPQRCETVYPPAWRGDEAYFIVVEAPELDAIRKKYGLPKRKYDYHITVGVRAVLALIQPVLYNRPHGRKRDSKAHFLLARGAVRF